MERQKSQPLVVISGGSRGIGFEVLSNLYPKYDVLNISRSHVDVKGIVNRHLFNLPIDLSKPGLISGSINSWFELHSEYYPKYFVSCAADLPIAVISTMDVDSLEKTFRVNSISPLIIAESLIKVGRNSRHKLKVLYVTSSLGRIKDELSFSGLGGYSMSKAALNRGLLVQRREVELRNENVEISSAHPGIVHTDMQNKLRSSTTVDPRFMTKTEALQSYKPGDWASAKASEKMKTITAVHSANFLIWILENGDFRKLEHDFYYEDDFHLSYQI